MGLVKSVCLGRQGWSGVSRGKGGVGQLCLKEQMGIKQVKCFFEEVSVVLQGHARGQDVNLIF